MRTCGSCTLCCHTTWVPELNKPEDCPCPHQSFGCSKYLARPLTCRHYACEWLTGSMDEFMQPDKVGFLVERISATQVILKELPGVCIRNMTMEAQGQLEQHFTSKGISVIRPKG